MRRFIASAIIAASVFGFIFSTAAASVLQGFQGGTGYGSATTSNVGQALIVASTSPYLTWTFGNAGGSFTTTTINGLTTTTFTFSAGTGLSIATSTPDTITYTNTGVTTNTGNWAGTWQLYHPSDFLSSSTQYLKSINGATSSAQFIVGGTGISVSTANPTTTITNTGVTSLNSIAGALTLAGSGGTSISTVGSTITIATVSTSTSNTWGGTQTFTNPIVTNGISNTGNVTSTTEVITTSTISHLVLPNVTSSLLATDANGNVVATTTSGGGTPAGSSNDVQFNNGGVFGADTGNFTYNSSTKQLALSTASSSLNIGTSSNFYYSIAPSSTSFSYSGSVASWNVPNNLQGGTITINVIGAAGGTDLIGGNVGGHGGSATGTYMVTPGTTLYIDVGGQNGYNGGGSGGVGGSCSGGGTGGTAGTQTTPAGGGIATGSCGPGGNATNFGGGGGSGNNFANGPSGGGMTWVSTASTFSTSTAILVGGGGGGGADGAIGGNAGGISGSAGVSGTAGAGSGGGGASFIASSGLTSTSTAVSANTGNGSVTLTYNIFSSDISSSIYTLAVGGHIITGGKIPSTTNATVIGNDTAGFITMTANVTTSTLTFGHVWISPPVCTANIASGTLAYLMASPNITSTVFTANTALSVGSKIAYHCLGY